MAKFSHQSPYLAFDGNPILLPDPRGLSTDGGDEKTAQKERVDVLVVPGPKTLEGMARKKRKQTERGIKQAKSAAAKQGYTVIEAESSGDLVKKLKNELEPSDGPTKMIGNLVIEGHGWDVNPAFQIGKDKIVYDDDHDRFGKRKFDQKGDYYDNSKSANNKIAKSFEKISEYTDENTTVVFNVCYLGNQDPDYGGEKMLNLVHNSLNGATVVASQSYSVMRPNRNLGESAGTSYDPSDKYDSKAMKHYKRKEGEGQGKFIKATGKYTIIQKNNKW